MTNGTLRSNVLICVLNQATQIVELDEQECNVHDQSEPQEGNQHCAKIDKRR